MPSEITREQFNELDEILFIDGREGFNKALEEYTGIEARPYTAYQYYDGAGNYVGDSDNDDLNEILRRAYISVKE